MRRGPGGSRTGRRVARSQRTARAHWPGRAQTADRRTSSFGHTYRSRWHAAEALEGPAQTAPRADVLGCIPAAALSDVKNDRLRRWMPVSVGVVSTLARAGTFIDVPPTDVTTALSRGGGPRRTKRRLRPDPVRRRSARPGPAGTARSGDSTRRIHTPPRRRPGTHAASSPGQRVPPACGLVRPTV